LNKRDESLQKIVAEKKVKEEKEAKAQHDA